MEKTLRAKSKLFIEKLAFLNKITGERNLNYLDVLFAETDKEFFVNKYLYAAFDVKNFRYVNNAMGYEGGNEVLRIIARCINDDITDDELLIHAEGDYFTMLLTYDDKEGVIPRITSMFSNIEKTVHKTFNNSLNLVFACGIYFITHPDFDVRYLSDRANLARNSRKNLFSNQIVIYNDEMEKQILEKKSIEEEMEKALDKNEFVVYLQPKINMVTNKVYAAEALVRWFHAADMIMPGRFIPLFEENGFIVKMDLFMFREICRLKKRWNDDENLRHLTISVNFSRAHFYYSDFVQKLLEICKECGISPGEIEVELTESAFIENYGSMVEEVKYIKEAGFGLSIDDFGTGYSSLNLLKLIPADVIKIDRQFISDDDDKSQKIIRHIISMIRDIRVQVITEGVETEQQVNFLIDSGCENAQGFYYSRPLPVEEFEKFAVDHMRERINYSLYTFNGHINDQNGLNPGVIVGEGITFVDGPSPGRKAAHFPGGAARMNTVKLPPSLAIGENRTVAFWVKLDVVTQWNACVHLRYNNGFTAFYPHGAGDSSSVRIRDAINSEDMFDVNGARLLPDVWYHIAFTYDSYSRESRYYINGEQIGVQHNVIPLSNLKLFCVGGDTYQESLKGTICDLFFYSGVKNAEEIKTMFAQYHVEPQTHVEPEGYLRDAV